MSVETCKVRNKNGTVKIIMVKDLPQCCTAVGAPAKPIKYFEE